MKNKLTLLKRIVAGALSASLLLSGINAFAAEVTIGGDDFSKYSQGAVPDGEWEISTPNGSAITVDDGMMNFVTPSSFSGKAIARYTLPTAQNGVIYIEYRVKLARTSANFCAPYVYSDSGKLSVCTMFNNKGKLQTHVSGAYKEIGTYESEKWYSVKHILDYDNTKFSVVVDGNEAISDVAFRNKDSKNLSYLEFYADKANSDMSIDDFKIYKIEKNTIDIEEVRLITKGGSMTLTDGMGYIPTDSEAIEIEFSKAPDASTVSDENISIDGIDYQGSLSGKVWRIELKEELAPGKRYTIAINGVSVGDSDAINKTVSFNTMGDVLYYEGFEFCEEGEMPPEFANEGGVTGVKDSKSSRGKVLSIEGSSVQSTAVLGMSPKDLGIEGDGIFVLEFDIYTQKSANAAMPYIFNSYNQASVCSIFAGSGQVNVRNGENNVSVGNFTDNKWYNVKICCNFKDGTFNYLLDGKLVADKFSYRYKLTEEGGEIKFYIPEGKSGEVMIDNISIYQADIPTFDTENIEFSSSDKKTNDKADVMADVKTITLGCDFEASEVNVAVERNGKTIDAVGVAKNSKLVVTVNEPLVYGGKYTLSCNAESVYGAKADFSVDFKVEEADVSVKKVNFTDNGAQAVVVNNTTGNKNVRVFIAAFDENNIMTGINCLNPTLVPGENDIFAELEANGEYKLYIWNDDMCGPCEYAVYTENGAEGVCEKKPALKNKTLTVPEELEIKYPSYTGRIEAKATEGGIVSVIVLKKGATTDSFESSDVVYIGQVLCDENNKAVFDITIGSTSLLSGEYDIYVSADGMSENKKISLNVLGTDALEGIVKLLNGKETAKELITDVFENAQMLAVDTEEADNNTELYAYMEEELFKKLPFASYEKFVVAYNDLYYPWIFNKLENTADNVTKYAEKLGIDLSEDAALTKLFNDESEAKAFVEGKLSGKRNFTKAEEIGEFYNSEAALYAINTAERGNILERCTMFEKWLEIEAEETIKELTNSQLQDLAIELYEAQEYRDIKTFAEVFEETAEDVTAPKSSNKGSSGGGGGGGGGSAFVGVSSVETAVDTTKEVKSSKNFADVNDDMWFAGFVNRLGNMMIVSGDEKGNFNPDNDITRAEFIKLLVSVLGCHKPALVSDFDDVGENDWYNSYVASAKEAGFVSGYDNKVMPKAAITRQDAAVMAVGALEKYGVILNSADLSFDDGDTISDYATESVAKAIGGGIMNGMGDGSFAPGGNMTRAQAAVVICGLMEVLK